MAKNPSTFVRLSDVVRKEIVRLAKQEQRTLSQMIRVLVTEALESRKRVA